MVNNTGFFTILFMGTFFIQQIIFIIIVTSFYDVPKWLSALIGIFALVVVTTASLEKFVW